MESDKRVLVVGLLVVLAGIAFVASQVETSEPDVSPKPVPELRAAPPLSGSETRRRNTENQPADPEVVPETDSAELMQTEGSEPARVNKPDAGTTATPDGGEVGGGPEIEWKDPVNQRVLGSSKWMAEATPEMNERINEAFQKHEARKDRRIGRVARKTAIETARPVVDRCYEQSAARFPGLTGRVIVAFEASATGKRGVIKDVRLSSIVKLNQDAEFVPCVRDGLEGLSFPAIESGEPLTVEYPFFYDSNRRQ